MPTAFVLLWIAVGPNGVTLTSGSARFESQGACETGKQYISIAYVGLMANAPKNDAGPVAWEAKCVPAD